MSNGTEYKPTSVSSPGSTLADILEMKEITPQQFAQATGLNEAVFTNILEGKAPIMPTVALVFARHAGGTPAFWLKRDEAYRRWLASQEEAKEKEESPYTDLWDRLVVELEVQGRKDHDNLRRLRAFLEHGTFQEACGDAGVWVRSAVINVNAPHAVVREVKVPRCALEPRPRGECDDAECPGWGWSSDLTDVLQRCDTCRVFESDAAALQHVQRCEACQRVLGAQVAATVWVPKAT